MATAKSLHTQLMMTLKINTLFSLDKYTDKNIYFYQLISLLCNIKGQNWTIHSDCLNIALWSRLI